MCDFTTPNNSDYVQDDGQKISFLVLYGCLCIHMSIYFVYTYMLDYYIGHSYLGTAS